MRKYNWLKLGASFIGWFSWSSGSLATGPKSELWWRMIGFSTGPGPVRQETDVCVPHMILPMDLGYKVLEFQVEGLQPFSVSGEYSPGLPWVWETQTFVGCDGYWSLQICHGCWCKTDASLHVWLTAAIRGLVIAEVYKVIDLLHCVAVNSDIRCQHTKTKRCNHRRLRSKGPISYNPARGSVQIEILKVDKKANLHKNWSIQTLF